MADVDVSKNKHAAGAYNFLNCKDLHGRRKIKLSINPEEFFNNPKENIIKYISEAIAIHDENVSEIQYLKNYKNGLQNILAKMRKDGSDINNIEVVNYAYEFIQFKKGFTVGKPIKYIANGQDENNEKTYFDEYLKFINKESLDLDKYEDIYTSGVAYTICISQKRDYDEEEEAPFIYKKLDNEKTFIAYADDMLETELFSCYISSTKDSDGISRDTYTCYYDYKSLILRYGNNGYEIIQDERAINIRQPITEYCLNQDRIGVFEPVISQLNSFNTIRSNQLDDIEQFINAFLVFVNQDPKFIMENIDKFRKKKAIALKSPNPQMAADVKLLQQQLDSAGVNETYENSKNDVFAIVGVPMPTSNTGQGVSGEAQTYGGGWENAQAVASVETTYIKKYEREDLKKMLYLCKKDIKSKIKNLSVKNIDIKYTINKSNNILVKAQAFKYFIDAGATWEVGLELANASDDSHLIGEQMEKHIEEKKMKEIDLEVYKNKLLSKVQKNEDSNEKASN